jgi:trans-2,3-dihydro-3-hydroxyanthranilate isomerase
MDTNDHPFDNNLPGNGATSKRHASRRAFIGGGVSLFASGAAALLAEPAEANASVGLKYLHMDVFSSKPMSGNGVTVFLLQKALPAPVMQQLTREMRQFESIFLVPEAEAQTVRARVFTMEEELDFAGHPVLGAASALHQETMAGVQQVSWTFRLNKKNVPVQTVRQESHYRAEMDQGICDLGVTLSPQESIPFLEALNLGKGHILDKFPLQIASTGLPYLLVPVDRDLDLAHIKTPDFEQQLARYGAKFVYVFDVTRKEGRTWDNDGRVEDIATGSAAGPTGAYFAAHGLARPGETIEIAQGRFVGRPSTLFVKVEMDGRGRLGVKVAGDVCLFADGRLAV